MKATKLIKTLQSIVAAEGDLEVDISLAKQKESDQQYLVADARFVEIEKYKDPEEMRISIRDWPY